MKYRFFFTALFAVVFHATISAQEVPTIQKELGVVVKDVPMGYTVGPGDVITGTVSGEEQFNFVTTVDQDGMIEVPFHDQPLAVRCKTESQLKGEIGTLMAKYLRNPQMSVRVTERKSRPPASIYGEVVSPQQMILLRKATLIELLAFAGGVKEEAGGMVQIFRTQPAVCNSDFEASNWRAETVNPGDVPSRMYSLASVRTGQDDSNPIIYPGDVVVVQKAPPIYVTGEVLDPQGLYLKEGGMTLGEAIAKVRGVRPGAKTKQIKIYRLKPNSRDREVILANLDMINREQAKNIMLEPYDIIEVDKAKESIAATVLKFTLGMARTAASAGSTNIGYRVIQ